MLQKLISPVMGGFLFGFIISTLFFISPDLLNMKRPVKNAVLQYHSKAKISPKILCWIMTGPENHLTKAIHVKHTWGSHCDKLLFMSSKEDKQLGAIALDAPEGRQGLWGKTKRAFQHVYHEHFNEFDWFMKADDDTFVIVENMKALLSKYQTTDPIHFGHTFKFGGDYFSGGAGYVLSKEALKRFVLKGLTNATMCHQQDDGDEDALLGECMRNLQVKHGDSRDEKKLKRFFPFEPKDHIIPRHGKKDDYYLEYYEKFPEKNGTACCSDTAISFHYISPPMQYVMYYLVYHLRPVKLSYTSDEVLANIDLSNFAERPEDFT